MIAQIFFIDFFLGYEFQTYGLDVLNYSEMEPEERGDPMHVVFPKVGIRYILFSTKKVFMVAYTVVSLLVIQMIQIFMQYFILLKYNLKLRIIFPLFVQVTKCSFHKYGPSGTVEIKDGLCVLPLNIINEKMFIFIWFWLVLVSVISGVFLLYRLAVLLGPQIRVALITVKGGKSTKRSDVEAILDPEVISYFMFIFSAYQEVR